MSDMSNSNSDERGGSLLSLASWTEPPPEQPPGPLVSPLLSSLASAPEPAAWPPVSDTHHSEPSAPSVADLLRRRSRELADRPAGQPVGEAAAARPVEEPRSKRLKLPRADRGKEALRRPPEQSHVPPSDPGAMGTLPASKPGKGRSGSTPRGGGAGRVIDTLIGILRQPRKPATAIENPPPPVPRSARLRLPRNAAAALPAAGNTGRDVSAMAPEVPRNRSPRDWSPNRSPQASGEAMRDEHMPASMPSASAHAPAPPPVHAHSMQASPAWPPAMAGQTFAPSYFPAMPSALMHPASAHFYWPQPAVAPQPVAWQPQLAPAVPWASAAVAHVRQMPEPMRPYAATDVSSLEQPAPASHPLTAEIDEVRDRLRAFGDSLRELRRTRSARRIG